MFANVPSRHGVHRDGYQASDSTAANFFLAVYHVMNALRNWSHATKNEIAEKTITRTSSLECVRPMKLETAMTTAELNIIVSTCESSRPTRVLH